MNIFKVLSQGNGRITETNMSAMLAYLLTPTETHGLGDVFLKKFLKIIDSEMEFYNMWLSSDSLVAEIRIESPYEINEKTRSLDIDISIYKRNPQNEYNELVRIGVENKIKANSAEKEQFNEEYLGLKEEVDSDTNIIMVFLTPKSDDKKLKEEYDELNLGSVGKHRKTWIYWHDEDITGPILKAMGQKNKPRFAKSITEILLEILKEESLASIDPISDYVRHTLKAFIQHIKTVLSPEPGIMRKKPVGDILEEATAILENHTYKLIRYNTKKIVITDETEGTDIINTKEMLRTIIKKLELKIDLNSSSGNNPKNTRQLGKEVIRDINGGPFLSGGTKGRITLER